MIVQSERVAVVRRIRGRPHVVVVVEAVGDDRVRARVDVQAAGRSRGGGVAEPRGERSGAGAQRESRRPRRRARGDRHDPAQRRFGEPDRRGAAIDLDALDVAERQRREIDRPTRGDGERNAVDVEAHLVGVGPAQRDRREVAHAARTGDDHPRHLDEQVAEIVEGARALRGEHHAGRGDRVGARRGGGRRGHGHDGLIRRCRGGRRRGSSERLRRQRGCLGKEREQGAHHRRRHRRTCSSGKVSSGENIPPAADRTASANTTGLRCTRAFVAAGVATFVARSIGWFVVWSASMSGLGSAGSAVENDEDDAARATNGMERNRSKARVAGPCFLAEVKGSCLR